MAELKSILLAEDNPKDVELTLTALEENHLANEVVVASDGEEALDYLFRRGRFAMRAEGNPAVVLLDLKMPRVDGLEVLRRIKSDETLKTFRSSCSLLRGRSGTSSRAIGWGSTPTSSSRSASSSLSTPSGRSGPSGRS